MTRAHVLAVLTALALVVVLALFVAGLALIHAVLSVFAVDPGPYVASGAIGIDVILVICLLLAGWAEKNVQPPTNPWGDSEP